MSEYLIWSNEHSAWWGPGGNGYVHRVEYAGRSSQERAMIICTDAMLGRRGHAPLQELPVRLEDVGEIRLSTLCGSCARPQPHRRGSGNQGKRDEGGLLRATSTDCPRGFPRQGRENYEPGLDLKQGECPPS